MGYKNYMIKEKIMEIFSFKPYKILFVFISLFLFLMKFDFIEYKNTKCEIYSYGGHHVHKITDNSGEEKYYTILHKYTVKYADGYKDISVKQATHERVVKQDKKYLYVFEKVSTKHAGRLILFSILSGIGIAVFLIWTFNEWDD